MKRYSKKLRDAVFISLEGFKVVLKETAFQMELCMGIPAIIFAIFSYKSNAEKALLVFSIFFLLIVEIFNTAIEKIIDRISLDHHPISKKVKDIGSCMVFISAIAVVAIWTIIYIL